VNEFHRIALLHGGTRDGAPGIRAEYDLQMAIRQLKRIVIVCPSSWGEHRCKSALTPHRRAKILARDLHTGRRAPTTVRRAGRQQWQARSSRLVFIARHRMASMSDSKAHPVLCIALHRAM
jgi:hypothetical protein